MPKTRPYKRKEENWIFPFMGLKLPMKNQSNITQRNRKIPVKVVMIIKRKISTNRMNKSMGNLKRLNHQCLTVRLKKEKRWKLGYKG